MNTVTFDTHAAIRKLQDADLSEQQAETLVEVFSHAIGDPLTKTDLDALKADIDVFKTDIKADIDVFKTDIKADIDVFKADVKAGLAALDARMGALEARITWRIVLALGAFAALVRLIP